MQFVFDEADLRKLFADYLQRFEEEVKIDWSESIFTFGDRHESFTSLIQLALKVAD